MVDIPPLEPLVEDEGVSDERIPQAFLISLVSSKVSGERRSERGEEAAAEQDEVEGADAGQQEEGGGGNKQMVEGAGGSSTKYAAGPTKEPERTA